MGYSLILRHLPHEAARSFCHTNTEGLGLLNPHETPITHLVLVLTSQPVTNCRRVRWQLCRRARRVSTPESPTLGFKRPRRRSCALRQAVPLLLQPCIGVLLATPRLRVQFEGHSGRQPTKDPYRNPLSTTLPTSQAQACRRAPTFGKRLSANTPPGSPLDQPSACAPAGPDPGKAL